MEMVAIVFDHPIFPLMFMMFGIMFAVFIPLLIIAKLYDNALNKESPFLKKTREEKIE